MKNIPKILHLYWDGSPMSELQMLTVVTFHKVNPDWKIIVHTPLQGKGTKQKFIPEYTGLDYFPRLKELSYLTIVKEDIEDYCTISLPDILRSDILRYQVLYDTGGVWSDFDVLWLKSFEDFWKVSAVWNSNVSTEMSGFVCLHKTIEGHHSIGVLASVPGNEFYSDLIKECTEIQRTCKNLQHQTFGADMLNRLFPKLKDITSKYPGMVGVPYKTFYPYSIFNLAQLYQKDDLTVLEEDVLAVHWFNGHRLAKQYVNNKNRHEQKNSINRILSLIKTE